MSKTVTFYYVRHGETRFNLRGRVQGVCDSPLTAKGIHDAERARDALKNIDLKRAFSSPASRASDTAEIIISAHPGLQVEIIKDLHEFDYGSFEGELHHSPEMLKEFDARRESRDYTDVGGETLEKVEKRIDGAFAEMIERCEDGDHILVVSHGTYCQRIINHLFHFDYHTLPAYKEGRDVVPNGGIMTFRSTDGEWELLHLPQEPEEFGKKD